MRILILELFEGQSKVNLESLLDGSYHVGIDLEVMNFADIIEPVEGVRTEDYFEFLQSASNLYSQDTVEAISRRIMKESRSFDYIMCPIGSDSKASVLNYSLSWIMSYTDPGALRGTVYYANKNDIKEEGVSQKLYDSFKDLFDFEKIVTKSGDVLFLDMPDKHKGFFKKIGVKLDKPRRNQSGHRNI